MIHLEILTSNDPLSIGLYEFEYDHLLIGRSKKNDLIFLDRELPLNYIMIEVVEDHLASYLVVRSLTRAPFFFINGKKISGALKIRIGDIVAFGENKIKIIDFKKTREESDLSGAFAAFAKNAPELKFALEFIEEVLVEAEAKANHV
ncbi:MAG: hypothetical protein H7336_01240 [Bacteriovorax sp.]|nr:hypothetical protein [Bacteriovorax sp.]